MSNILLIYISGAATLIVGSAALITLSANAGRTAELAQGLGATDITQRGSAGSILLTLLRRLPFSKPLSRLCSSNGCADAGTNEWSDSSPSYPKSLECYPTEPRQACR